MDSDKIARLKETLKDKDTEELMAIWMDYDTEEWDKEALAAMEFILIDRGEERPHKDREESTSKPPFHLVEERMKKAREAREEAEKSVDVIKDCEPSESEESLDDALPSGDYKELRKIRRALGENNEHLQESNEHLKKIRAYIGWFWWILIGIPLYVLFTYIIMSIKQDETEKKLKKEQEQEWQELQEKESKG
jgi:hypothetical protein